MYLEKKMCHCRVPTQLDAYVIRVHGVALWSSDRATEDARTSTVNVSLSLHVDAAPDEQHVRLWPCS